MAEYAAKRDPKRCPTHPGELLREAIQATGKSKTEIAALLGISRQHLYDILAERKPISPAVAVRLGKLFGDVPGVWVRMQGAYDTWQAERELADEIKKIPRLKALRRFERLKAPSFADHLLAMPTDEGAFERLRGRLRKAGF